MAGSGNDRDSLADAFHAAFREKAATDVPEDPRKRKPAPLEKKVAALASEVAPAVSERESPRTLVDEIAPLGALPPWDEEEEDRPTLIDPVAPAPTSTDAPPLRPSSSRQRKVSGKP